MRKELVKQKKGGKKKGNPATSESAIRPWRRGEKNYGEAHLGSYHPAQPLVLQPHHNDGRPAVSAVNTVTVDLVGFTSAAARPIKMP